jgi:SAM-dependent methyltransferase
MNIDSGLMDYDGITRRQQATWAAGDFHELGRQTLDMSEALVRAADPHAGQRVLDVACGTGNAALIAARRYCEVTAIDFVPALIERAKTRAKAEGMDVDFRVEDAPALPFPDATFDVVVSSIGVMFAPDQEKAAGELLRVCRPGGTIGLASWMPDGFGGDFFAAHARHAPPPTGIKPPVRWGTDIGLNELLGHGIHALHRERRTVDVLFARSIAHAMDIYRQ